MSGKRSKRLRVVFINVIPSAPYRTRRAWRQFKAEYTRATSLQRKQLMDQ